MALRVIDRESVRRLLPLVQCVEIVRDAMCRLSAGQTLQPLRQILPMSGERLLAVMPGAMSASEVFGAKVLGIDPANRVRGRQLHQGGILLFDPATSEPVALVHAGAVTSIRTAAASAVATEALALRGAATVAILGYGEQALEHVEAMNLVRQVSEVRVWGRDIDQAAVFARRLCNDGTAARAVADVAGCVRGAQIICTTTAAYDPILYGNDVAPGTHVNLVGSSVLGPREADDGLVRKARFFGDYRLGVLAQGSEFCHARDAGLIDDNHFVGEIGEVLNGDVPGRRSDDEITVYKSLGHIVQDLSSAAFVYHAAVRDGLRGVSF